MTFEEKVAAVLKADAAMESSKVLCLKDAVSFHEFNPEHANKRLEKAAQYAWGNERPAGWVDWKDGE